MNKLIFMNSCGIAAMVAGTNEKRHKTNVHSETELMQHHLFGKCKKVVFPDGFDAVAVVRM